MEKKQHINEVLDVSCLLLYVVSTILTVAIAIANLIINN